VRRAFVIQLHPETDLRPGKWSGRVEHVDSGQADHFRSEEELLRFIERTVTEIEATEYEEGQNSIVEPKIEPRRDKKQNDS
jgi:hypothetical protein